MIRYPKNLLIPNMVTHTQAYDNNYLPLYIYLSKCNISG